MPNQKVNLNLLYNGSTTATSGGDLAEETNDYTRAGEADLSITPVQTVYLFGSYRIEKSTTISQPEHPEFYRQLVPLPGRDVAPDFLLQ